MHAWVDPEEAYSFLSALSHRPLTPLEAHAALEAIEIYGHDASPERLIDAQPEDVLRVWETKCGEHAEILERLLVTQQPIPRTQLSLVCMGDEGAHAAIRALLEHGALLLEADAYSLHESLRQWWSRRRTRPALTPWRDALLESLRADVRRRPLGFDLDAWSAHLDVLSWLAESDSLPREDQLVIGTALMLLRRTLEHPLLYELTAWSQSHALCEASARFLSLRGSRYLARGELDFAEELLSDLAARLLEQPTPSRWSSEELAYTHATMAHLALERRDHERADELCRRALERCPTGHYHAHATCRAAQAHTACQRGNPLRALESINKAWRSNKHVLDPNLKARVLLKKAHIHAELNEHELAQWCLSQVTEDPKLARLDVAINAHNIKGLLHMRLGQHDLAQRHLQHALEGFESMDLSHGVAIVASNQALCALDRGDVDEATSHCRIAARWGRGSEPRTRCAVAVRCCLVELLCGYHDQAARTYANHIQASNDRRADTHLSFDMCSLEVVLSTLPQTRRADMLHPRASLRRLETWAENDPMRVNQHLLLHLFHSWLDPEVDALEWLVDAEGIDSTLLAKTTALRLLARLVSQQLTDTAREPWRHLCSGTPRSEWWMSDRLIRSPSGTWHAWRSSTLQGRMLRLLSSFEQGLDTETLISLLWPHQNLEVAQGRNRLYVSLAKMRANGLDLVSNRDGVYMIDPSIGLRWL